MTNFNNVLQHEDMAHTALGARGIGTNLEIILHIAKLQLRT